MCLLHSPEGRSGFQAHSPRLSSALSHSAALPVDLSDLLTGAALQTTRRAEGKEVAYRQNPHTHFPVFRSRGTQHAGPKLLARDKGPLSTFRVETQRPTCVTARGAIFRKTSLYVFTVLYPSCFPVVVIFLFCLNESTLATIPTHPPQMTGEGALGSFGISEFLPFFLFCCMGAKASGRHGAWPCEAKRSERCICRRVNSCDCRGLTLFETGLICCLLLRITCSSSEFAVWSRRERIKWQWVESLNGILC
jgi:hypothetical protein